jgi:hypothetical protein
MLFVLLAANDADRQRRSLRVQRMAEQLNTTPDHNQAMVYQIRLKGHLGPQWSEWFGDLSITLEEDGVTLLAGPVADQAALHGLLKKVRDLGLPLLAISSTESSQ